MWFHDHGLGTTRLNVFAGLAAAYVLRDDADDGAARNPIGIPGGRYEIPLVIQDRQFSPDGREYSRRRMQVGTVVAIAAGVLGVSSALASPFVTEPTAAAAAPRCSVTPRVPVTTDGGTAIDASAVLKCRRREKRRVFVQVELQISPDTSNGAMAGWFPYGGRNVEFAKGVRGGKAIQIAMRPQRTCTSATWRTRTVLNVGGSKPTGLHRPKRGVTTLRFSPDVHIKLC